MNWISTLFWIMGMLTFTVSLLFLIFPRTLLRASEMANRIFEVDSFIFHYRKTIGICCIFVGLFLFLMAYYVYYGLQHSLFLRAA